MAQLTIYLPDTLAQKAKRDAKRSGKSVSRYLADLVSGPAVHRERSRTLGKLYGSWKGSFPDVEDLPLDEPDAL